MLRRRRPALFFEFAPWLIEASGHEPRDLLQFLTTAGYSTFLLLSAAGHPLELSSDLDGIVATATEAKYVDLACVHVEEERAVQRLISFARERGA